MMRLRFGWVLLACGLCSTSADAQIGMGQGGGGIFVDPEGVLRAAQRTVRSVKKPANVPAEVAVPSKLRRVSLKALDQQLRQLQPNQPVPSELELLAGLVKIQYVIVDRERQDVWLAGPAEAWEIDETGRQLGVKSGRPVLHLDDLAAALRCVLVGQGFVECSIDPQQQGLAAIQQYELPAATSRREAVPYQQEIEELYGLQTVRTSGAPAGSRFSLVMIEADYRMKRMALAEDRGPNVTSHLDVLARMVQEGVSRQNVLARWWFAPLYTAVRVDAEQKVFQFEGQAVQLLNEAVYLDRSGGRRGGGAAGPDWDEFARDFTKRFPEIEQRFPVFADLHNLFDLMMVAGLIKQQGLGGWFQESRLLDADAYPLPLGSQPEFAEPVINFKIHARKQGNQRITYCTFGWGGVAMQPSAVLAPDLFTTEKAAELASVDAEFAPPVELDAAGDQPLPVNAFWQDAKKD